MRLAENRRKLVYFRIRAILVACCNFWLMIALSNAAEERIFVRAASFSLRILLASAIGVA